MWAADTGRRGAVAILLMLAVGRPVLAAAEIVSVLVPGDVIPGTSEILTDVFEPGTINDAGRLAFVGISAAGRSMLRTDGAGDVDLVALHQRLTRLNLGKIQQIVQPRRKPRRFVVDDCAHAARFSVPPVVTQRLGEAEDGGERRLQIVRDAGNQPAHLSVGFADAAGHHRERLGEPADLISALD